MKRPGLRFKLTLLYSAMFTLLLAGLFIGAYYLFENRLDTDATAELMDRMEALRGYLRFRDDMPVLKFNVSDPEVSLFVRNATRYYQIYDAESGALVTQSLEMQLLGLSFVPEELRTIGQGPGPVDFETDNGTFRFLNDQIVSPSGRKYIVQVGASLEQVRFALRRFSRLGFFLIPCGVVLAASAGWFLARGVLAPIGRMALAARAIEISNLSHRLPLTGAHDELDHLATTFNEVFDRLEQAVDELRQLTGSIAHELRTPLAALRGEAEIALLHARSVDEVKDVLGSQLEEFDKLNRMIDRLLTLVQAESGAIQFNLRPFDLALTVRTVVDNLLPLAIARQISLESDPGANLIAEVDPQWLEHALVNLLDNAIKYTPPGGVISIQGRLDSGAVRIEVRDSGPGISADALPHIFERFYRADPARNKQVSGVGLGLSFVKWIVEGHGGTIEVASQVNHGSSFTIRLPGAAKTTRLTGVQ